MIVAVDEADDLFAGVDEETDADDLKIELKAKGLIATGRRGKSGISYVVKRSVHGVKRIYVVAIRAYKPKGGARASAAP